ncbi:MAG: hypothetical protein PHI40_08060 [Caldisericia bacterium]|nr:hypothetical protein [Caldisericia bacterium]
MKKFLVWMLIVVLLPLSYTSYRLLEKHTIRFQFFTNTLPNQIVPDNEIELSRTQSMDPLANPLILFISNHTFETPGSSFLFEEKSKETGSIGFYPVYPIMDPDISLVNVCSGVSPHRGGYLSRPLMESLDNIFLSAKDAELQTAYFGDHLPEEPSEIEEEVTIAETYSESLEQTELKIPASYVEPIHSIEDVQQWLEQFESELQEFDVLIFNIPVPEELTNIDNQDHYIQNVNKVMTKLYDVFQEDAQYFYTTPLVFSSLPSVMLLPNVSIEAPIYCFGKNIVSNQTPFRTHLENISSSLCFSLGISSTQENTSPPLLSLYDVAQEEYINRVVTFLNSQMMSYMNVLLSYGINEETVSGYILHVNDSINTIPIQDLPDLQNRVDLLQQEFQSFVHTQNDKTRKQELILFILLIAIAGALWLLFSLWNWRGYLYGIGFLILYYFFHTIVFQNSFVFPPLHSITLEWAWLTYGPSLLLTGVVCSIITTVLDGYMWNVDVDHILKDLNGQVATFVTFLILHGSIIGIQYGYTFTGTLDTFPTQQLFLHNETLLVMMPIVLLLMFGIALLLHWILSKNQRKTEYNEKKA